MSKANEQREHEITSESDSTEFQIDKEAIGDEIKKLSSAEVLRESGNLLLIKRANTWLEEAKTKPVPRMLFGSFWFEGEICVLFSDTNVGKSILAAQIADCITFAKPNLDLDVPAEGQKVLLLDFEHSEKQFENRYSIDYKQHYSFHNDFLRCELNPNAEIPEGFDTFEDFLKHSLEQSIIEFGIKILIIDNITYLEKETEKAKNALPLMQHLKLLKSKYGLSILVLAHTPKRDKSRPLTENDIQGSKMIANFMDSCFAIGESTAGVNYRYIKQIKTRNLEKVYHAENVMVCEIVKPHNFVQFQFRSLSTEAEHLQQTVRLTRDELTEKIQRLHSSGLSTRKIAKEVGVSAMTVSRKLGDIVT